MANEYLVAIHNYISDKIAATQKILEEAGPKNDPASAGYCEGQLAELNAIRRYMVAKIDLKTQKYY